MKKVICIVLTLILCITAVTCFAESDPTERFGKNEEPTYYICRPNVKCRSLENPEDFVTLHFGEEVKILEQRGEYTDIEYGDEQKGYVTTGFIAEVYYPMLYIAKDAQQYLSPFPTMNETDFGYGAGGLRWDERAIVIYAIEDYFYIVTEEGFCGYIPNDSPYISIYTGE